MDELIILADEATDALAEGYLPAARRLGLRVTVLADRTVNPSALAPGADEVAPCDVTDSLHVIGALTRRRHRLVGIFTDSPRLQTCAAVAAEYLHLPGKDWHVTYRASDTGEMHRRMAELGMYHACRDAPPDEGDLHTLSTLGDGRELRAVGGAGQAQADAVVGIIREFGIGLGVCQTRYLATARGPRIVDIRYCGPDARAAFELQERLGIKLFETILRLHLGEPLPALAPPKPAAAAYGLTLSTIRRWASSKTQVFS